MQTKLPQRCAPFAAAILLTLALAACATARKCGTTDCPPDDRITDQVRTAIFQRPELAGLDIRVQTKGGVVYLYGLVDTRPQKSTVESLARETPGVTRVVNSIEIRLR